MHKNLLILGAGQYGMVAHETAEAMKIFEKIAFLDDQREVALGRMSEYITYRGEYNCAFVAIGNPYIRMEWLRKLREARFQLPALIHPRAYVSPSVKIGEGCIIEPFASVQSHAVLHDGVLISSNSVVNHNSEIFECAHIDCGSVIPSNSKVNSYSKIEYGMVYRNKNEILNSFSFEVGV